VVAELLPQAIRNHAGTGRRMRTAFGTRVRARTGAGVDGPNAPVCGSGVPVVDGITARPLKAQVLAASATADETSRHTPGWLPVCLEQGSG